MTGRPSIADDRLILERALLDRVADAAADDDVLARVRRELYGPGADPGGRIRQPQTGTRLRDVARAGAIARIYDDAQGGIDLPAAFVTFRGERLDVPASPHAVGQTDRQTWSVVLVAAMGTVLDTAADRGIGALVALVDGALRGWLPRVWWHDDDGWRWRGVEQAGPCIPVTGDPPLHEWERGILAMDLRYEVRLTLGAR